MLTILLLKHAIGTKLAAQGGYETWLPQYFVLWFFFLFEIWILFPTFGLSMGPEISMRRVRSLFLSGDF